MGKIKIALMIVAMVAVLLIAGSIGYYYIFYLPGNENAKLELEKQKFQQQKDIQTQESLDKVAQEKKATSESIAKNIALNSCLDQAYKDYTTAFDNAKSNYAKGLKIVSDTFTNNWNAECAKRGLAPQSPLPSNIADKLNKEFEDGDAAVGKGFDDAIAKIEKNYENAKNDCFKLHQ